MRSGGERRVVEVGVERVHGELDQERGAAFWAIEAFDASAVFLHDAVADAEAEAGALADGLGGEERIEDLLGGFDAGSAIGKLDDQLAVVVRGANHQRAAADFFQRVHGIADQVEENLQNLIGIAENVRQSFVNIGANFDVLSAQVQIAEVQRGSNHLVQI